jgi:N-methylhydantoinase A
MQLDRARAARALQPLARRLGRSLEATARGIVQVANAAMERALRVITVERGRDPRGFTLVAFGGAGALHAAELAEALGISRVYVPRQPGLLSAWGMLAAEVVRDYSLTLRLLNPSDGPLAAGLRKLTVLARRDLGREGVKAPIHEPALDVRYAGQSYEVSVPYRAGWSQQFHQAHERLYGHADTDRPIEVVTLRLRVRGGRARLPADAPARHRRAAPIGRQAVLFADGRRQTPIYRRDQLSPGRRLAGPAVICEYSATTLVPPGWRVTIDALGGLRLEAR